PPQQAEPKLSSGDQVVPGPGEDVLGPTPGAFPVAFHDPGDDVDPPAEDPANVTRPPLDVGAEVREGAGDRVPQPPPAFPEFFGVVTQALDPVDDATQVGGGSIA